MHAPPSQGRVFSTRAQHMVGTFDRERSEIDVASLGDAELGVAFPGLAPSRSQAKIAANIPTSLEAFLAAQRQNIRHCCELANTPDLEQRLRHPDTVSR